MNDSTLIKPEKSVLIQSKAFSDRSVLVCQRCYTMYNLMSQVEKQTQKLRYQAS
jgi:hypothetical protein